MVMENRFKLVGIDPSPMVPNSVVLGIRLKYLGCLLQKFWRVVTLADLEQNLSICVTARLL